MVPTRILSRVGSVLDIAILSRGFIHKILAPVESRSRVTITAGRCTLRKGVDLFISRRTPVAFCTSNNLVAFLLMREIRGPAILGQLSIEHGAEHLRRIRPLLCPMAGRALTSSNIGMDQTSVLLAIHVTAYAGGL